MEGLACTDLVAEFPEVPDTRESEFCIEDLTWIPALLRRKVDPRHTRQAQFLVPLQNDNISDRACHI